MALVIAAPKGDLRLVRRSLAAGCNVDELNSNSGSALMQVVRMNFVKIMTLLLMNGTPVHLKRFDDCSTLHVAISSQQIRAEKLLLDFDADTSAGDNRGVTPFMVAVENDSSSFIQLLVAASNGQVEAVRLFLECRVEVGTDCGDWCTALMLAASIGHVDVVDAFLDNQALIDFIAHDRNTVLTLAAERGKLGVVQALLVRGAAVNSHVVEVGPLAVAAQKGHVEIMKLFLLKIAKINAGNGDGDTALHDAAYSGQLESVRVLVDGSPSTNVNNKNLSGWSPLMEAVPRNHVEIIDLLLSKRASLLLKATNERTAMHIAAEGGRAQVIRLLIRNGAIVDAVDQMNRTPLIMTEYRGQEEAVKVLLENMTSLILVDSTQQTPLEAVLSNSKFDVVDLLVYNEIRQTTVRKKFSSPQTKKQRTEAV